MNRATNCFFSFTLTVPAVVLSVGCGAASPEQARDEARLGTTSEALHEDTLSVAFADCTELASIATIAASEARSLVPSSFVPVTDAAGAQLIVRVADCASVSVAGRRPQAGTVAQIGVVVATPDGTGDFNNYTVFYYTTSAPLAHRLQQFGIDAQHVPHITYQLTPAVGAAAARISVDVPRPGQPRFTIGGPVFEPTADAIPLVANWWLATDQHTIKMSTPIPAIRFGVANSTLRTARRGELGNILQASVVTDFSIFDSFNRFPSAEMTVSEVP